MWSILSQYITNLEKGVLNGYEKYYKIKFNTALKIKPKTICEIGVRGGYSAFAFLCAAPNAFFLGIDINNGTHGGVVGFINNAKDLLLKHNFNAQIMIEDSQKMNNLNNTEWDLVHIDGDHSYNGCLHDMEIAKLNSKNILIDDDLYINEVKRAVDNFYNKYNNYYDKEYIDDHLRGTMLFKLKNNMKFPQPNSFVAPKEIKYTGPIIPLQPRIIQLKPNTLNTHNKFNTKRQQPSHIPNDPRRRIIK